MKITTCHCCTWGRRNFEHCAQRRSPGDFEASNPPENAPFGSWSCSRNFSKIAIFHENFEISSPWIKICAAHNFSQKNFWKLKLAPSETTHQKLGLDKRKTQTIFKNSSTCQKTIPKVRIVTNHDWPRFGAGGRRILLKTASFRKAVSTSHISNEIHAEAFQSIQSSQIPPWKSPRVTAAREVAEILNIARSAGPLQILKPQALRKSLLLIRWAARGISAKSWFFIKNF